MGTFETKERGGALISGEFSASMLSNVKVATKSKTLFPPTFFFFFFFLKKKFKSTLFISGLFRQPHPIIYSRNMPWAKNPCFPTNYMPTLSFPQRSKKKKYLSSFFVVNSDMVTYAVPNTSNLLPLAENTRKSKKNIKKIYFPKFIIKKNQT